MRLRGSNIVIIGASGGIGSATALRCAQEGAHVMIHYSGRTKDSELRVREVLARTKALLKRMGLKSTVNAFPADVTRREAVRNLVKSISNEIPEVHGLVLYNGYYQRGLWKKHSGEYTEREEELIWKTDVLGTKYCVEEFSPIIIKSIKRLRKKSTYAQKTGSIVLTTSTPAFGSIPVDQDGKSIGGAFSSAKTAVLSIMRHAVIDYAPYVRINTIAPGNIETPGWAEELTSEEKNAAAEESPLRRWIRPEEVANVALFLLSHESSAVNNQIIAVDGGYVTGR